MNQAPHRGGNGQVVNRDPDANAASATRAHARDLLEHHPHFHCHCQNIEIEYDADTLILTGQVPSFYLKQLLQEVLRAIDGVKRIDNRVIVICSEGLSSGPSLD